MRPRSFGVEPRSLPGGLGILSALCLLAIGCGRGGGEGEQVLALTEAFPSARVHVETREIDLGVAEARPQMVFGWGHDEITRDQRSYVWAMGDRSELEVFAGRPRDVMLEVSGWGLPVKSLPKQEITVSINGREIGTARLSRGPRAGFAVQIPAEAWMGGPNRLTFDYSYSRRLIDISPKRQDTRPLAMAWDTVVLDGFEDGARPTVGRHENLPSLTLPLNSQVDFFFELAPGSSLSFDKVSPSGGDDEDFQATLRIEVARDGEGQPQVREVAVGATKVDPHILPLDIPEPARVRLSLRADLREGIAGNGILLVNPVVRSPGLQSDPVEEKRGRRSGERPNIIVYLIDTVRADHLGCYGYGLPVSPRIDAFAADSILFEKAYSQCSWTRPAVASVFTGVYPQVHGTNAIEDSLPADLPTMAELFKSAGYETAAVSTNSIAGPRWGFSRGMDRFQLLKERLKTVEVHRQSDAAHEVVFRWFRERPLREPFFLFVHSTDPHGPYTPREPYRTRFAKDVGDPSIGHWDRVKALKNLREDEVDPSLISDLTALYDAEIAFNDSTFGTLIDRLKAEQLYDSSMIVLFSDHGEEFYDHGRWMHGWSLYQEQLHVPLIIKMPGGAHAGSRSREVIELVDLLPTILEYAGLPVPGHVQGHSALAGLAENRGDRPLREAFAYLARSEPRHLHAYFRGDTKLIVNQAMDLPRAAVEVFDLDSDAGETTNLTEAQPVLAGFMTASFRNATARWGIRDLGSEELTDEQRERLKALGYVD